MPVPPTQTIAGADPLVGRILEGLLTASGGALVTLIAYRTKFAMMHRDIRDARKEAADAKSLATQLAATIERMLDKRMDAFSEEMHREIGPIREGLATLNRRTYAMLEIVVDLAQHSGLDKRLGNGLMRMLADRPPPHRDDEDNPHSPE